MRSCTSKVQAFSVPHPMDSSRKVVFVDTPGFDDTNTKDTDILQAIADWLEKTYKRGIVLNGLLFLHRITDNRMAGTPLKNLHMFQRLCGVNALRNVILVTTMWSEVDDAATALSREEELRTNYWKPMVSAGSRILRFDYNHESVWAIVDHLNGTPLPVQLQVELVDEGKSLVYTSAGSALFQWFENVISQLRDTVTKLEARLRGRPGAGYGNIAKETATVKHRLEEVTNQRDKLNNPTEMLYPISPEPMPLQSRFGLHKSESLWSITRIPSAADNNDLPEPHYSGKLVATISALRHARDIANGTTLAPLKGAVGLALTIAESVEGMRRNDVALFSLTQTAARFVVGITDNIQSGNVPDDTKQIVDDLIAELKAVDGLIKRRRSQRRRASAYIHQAGDANLIAACSERINNACHLFEMSCAIRTRQAIDRLGAEIAARANSSTPPHCSCGSTHS